MDSVAAARCCNAAQRRSAAEVGAVWPSDLRRLGVMAHRPVGSVRSIVRTGEPITLRFQPPHGPIARASPATCNHTPPGDAAAWLSLHPFPHRPAWPCARSASSCCWRCPWRSPSPPRSPRVRGGAQFSARSSLQAAGGCGVPPLWLGPPTAGLGPPSDRAWRRSHPLDYHAEMSGAAAAN